jgi:hypothetical protein
MSPKIFLGYSQRAGNQAKSLRDQLRSRCACDVTDWQSAKAFPPGKALLESLVELLDSHSFGVFILSIDDTLIRSNDPRDSQAVASSNVLFEAGLFIGRHSRTRTILLVESGVRLPADLAGIKTFHYRDTDGALDAQAAEIAEHIRNEAQNLQDSRLYALTLFECRASEHDNIIRALLEIREHEETRRLNIEIEAAGVTLGDPDDFLLFSAPTFAATSEFVKHLRHQLGEMVVDVETRHVFPGKLYRHPEHQTLKPDYLLLVSCKPERVEQAFTKLRREAERAAPGDPFLITHAGIIFGQEDLFFMVKGKPGASYQDFLNKHLDRFLPLVNLWKNQTTLSLLNIFIKPPPRPSRPTGSSRGKGARLKPAKSRLKSEP